MQSIKDICWLSGLLEGEGCFPIGRHPKTGHAYPRIQLDMTDKDIVEKAASILNAKTTIRKVNPQGYSKKTSYRFSIQGKNAIGWMMTLYPLMGSRRQERIRQCLEMWRNSMARKYTTKDALINGESPSRATLTKQAISCAGATTECVSTIQA